MAIRTRILLLLVPSLLALAALGFFAQGTLRTLGSSLDLATQSQKLSDEISNAARSVQQAVEAIGSYQSLADASQMGRFEIWLAETETSLGRASGLVSADEGLATTLTSMLASCQEMGTLGRQLTAGESLLELQSSSALGRIMSLGGKLESDLMTLSNVLQAQVSAGSEALRSAQQRGTLLIGLLVALCVLGGPTAALWISNELMRSLNELRRRVHAIGRGKLSSLPPTKGRDELSKLGVMISEAARSLEQQFDQQRALDQVARATVVGIAEDEALQRILEICLNVVGCERGAIFCLNGHEEQLTCAHSIGLSEGFVASLARSYKSLPCARVLRELKPAEVVDGQKVPLLSASGEAEVREGFKASAVLPMTLGGEAVGLMVLCRDDARGFEETSIRLAEILADHGSDVVKHQRQRRSVKEAETLYRSLFNQVPIGLYRATWPGEILDANPAAVQILGYPDLESVKRLNAKDLYVDQAERRRWMSMLLGGSMRQDFETRFRRYDGSVIWIRNNARVVRGDDGQVQYFEGMLEDVTSRREAEQTLKEGEERLRSVLQSTSDAIVSVDGHGKVIFWNDAARTVFGYRADEIVGSPFETIVAHHQSGAGEDAFQVVRSSENGRGQGQCFEIVGVRKDGSRFPVEMTLSRWVSSGGEFFTGILRDISQRKQAEKEIRKLSRAIEQGSSMVIITDKEGKIEYVNPRFCSLTGYSPQDVLGKSPDILKSGETSKAEYQRLREAISAGQEWHGVFQNRKKDGELYWASASISPILDENGAITHHLAVEEDITDRRRAETQIKQQLDRMAALRAVDNAISASLDPRVTFNILLTHVTKQLAVDAADILLFNPQSQTLDYVAGVGFRTDALQQTQLCVGRGHAGRAALERRMILVSQLADDWGDFDVAPQLQAEGMVSYVAVPLNAKGKVKGVLEIYNRSRLEPDSEWIEFLEALAAQGAIAIDSASLFDELQRTNLELTLTYDTTLEGWAKTLELRDCEKEGHTQRVTDLTIRLAREMGVRDSELVHVRRGAILHDIGKMGVPDRILLKPGPLDAEEWKVMKRHPVHAHHLLCDIEHLRPALAIPYGHHEKWDGSGYPRGLAGEQIAMAARIFAVVDVWDALRSDRPYRKAWSDDEALAYIGEQSGKHFDPKVVAAFLEMVNARPH